MVGGQRIYDRIRTDGKGGGSPLTHLRRRGRKRNRQGGRHAGRGHIPGRWDIPERPETVGEKVRTGDREADTVIGGGHGGAVVSPVDRASEQPPVQRVDGKRAEAVGGAITDLPEGPGARVHTVTAYDGREFAGHAKVAKAPGADFLLPTPHHSWERGLNGHADGPPRRYLPKGTDFREATDARVKRVRDILNARPLKALGHLTPAEAFARTRRLPPRGPATAGRSCYAPIRRDSRRVPRGSRAPGRKILEHRPTSSARATPSLRRRAGVALRTGAGGHPRRRPSPVSMRIRCGPALVRDVDPGDPAGVIVVVILEGVGEVTVEALRPLTFVAEACCDPIYRDLVVGHDGAVFIQ